MIDSFAVNDQLIISTPPVPAVGLPGSHSTSRARPGVAGSETLSAPASGDSTRRRWKIDDLLDGLRGQSIRVAAEAFAPIGENGPSPRLIRTNDLVLPDNTRTDGLPVFFEGVLLEVTRQIGVVHVRLGPPGDPQTSTEGCVQFRGRIAVILRGPAIVRLAIPFHAERVPLCVSNYWQDIHLPHAQFVFNFAEGGRRK